MEDIYQRTEILIGNENMQKIKNAKVCICGIGGVGSYTLEALARIGVGDIMIVDNDNVDITNINRQIIATVDNVGNSKVEEAKKRINKINPEVKINAIQTYISKDNINEYITPDLDYVVDAIDSIEAKIALIKRCKELNIKVISSMGMANKLDPLKIKVADISKTEVCPLARVIRKKLKEEKIKKVKTVFSTETAIKTDSKVLGSVSFVPSAAGIIIASEVVKDLIS